MEHANGETNRLWMTILGGIAIDLGHDGKGFDVLLQRVSYPSKGLIGHSRRRSVSGSEADDKDENSEHQLCHHRFSVYILRRTTAIATIRAR